MKRKFIIILLAAVCVFAVMPNFINIVKANPIILDLADNLTDKADNARKEEELSKEEEFRINLDKTFIGLAKKVGPAVVFIKAEFNIRTEFYSREQQEQGRGSGVIVSPDGDILTNYHVVTNEETDRQADEIWVELSNRRKFLAKICGLDHETDSALLKIGAVDLPYLPFANPNSLEVGKWVMVVGAPFGFKNSVSVGVISALERRGIGLPTAVLASYIQTDAAINPGNSGGPLVNLDGKLIGINTAMITGPFGGSQGVGFAISVKIAEPVFQQLKEHGKVPRGWLGIAGMDVEMFREMIEDYNIAFNDKDFLNKLREEIKSDIEYLRLKLSQSESPQDGFHGRSPRGHGGKRPSRNAILREIESLEDRLRFLNNPNFQETVFSIIDIQTATGVFVRGLDARGSPAKNANIAVGDLILEIDGRFTPNFTDLLDIIAGIPSGKEALVKIMSGSTLKWVTVKVGERPSANFSESRDSEEENLPPEHPPINPDKKNPNDKKCPRNPFNDPR